RVWAFILLIVPTGLATALRLGTNPGLTLIFGLAVFAVVFAVNSAMHSYLVLAYTDEDSVALNVGFYYMANAAGRLLGTLLSGLVFSSLDLRDVCWDRPPSCSLLACYRSSCLAVTKCRSLRQM